MSSSSSFDGPKDLRSRRREATRHEILQAARQVFCQVGLYDAKMEEIAAKAGVSVGTLYNYFDDREGLLDALCEALHVELLASIDAVLAQNAERNFVQQLHALIGCVLKHFEANRLIMAAVFEAQGERAATAKAQMKARMQSLYERVQNMCAAGLKSGALRPQGAALYPAMLLGMIRGVTLRAYVRDGSADNSGANTGDAEPPLTAAEDAITELFLHGASAERGVNNGVNR